jgi:hypothetical protein
MVPGNCFRGGLGNQSITENLAILTGSRQTTDSYLAGLAFRKKGRLATLDGRVAWRSVRGARPDLIEKIVD